MAVGEECLFSPATENIPRTENSHLRKRGFKQTEVALWRDEKVPVPKPAVQQRGLCLKRVDKEAVAHVLAAIDPLLRTWAFPGSSRHKETFYPSTKKGEAGCPRGPAMP